MRPLVAVLFAAGWCCQILPASDGFGQGQGQRQEQEQGQVAFPYKAYVAAEDVYVRSGPGQNYYPTDKLKRGQAVEVYRHDPGGWCAIRPVDGSFTWVSGRFIKPTGHHLGVITEEDVSARVGSRLSDVRDVVQVRLHRGEAVEILEAPPGDANVGAWYKIAPPSGEFRWVSGKHLDIEDPRDGLRRRHDDRRDSTAPEGDWTAAATSRQDRNSDDSQPARSARPRPLSAEEYQKELDRVELELSIAVAGEPAAWSFGSLREQANWLIDEAQTAVERGRARLLADKIARFDDVRRRQEALPAVRGRTDRSSRLYARLYPKDNAAAAAQQEIDGRFDGVGQLTQVASPKQAAPRYALVDRSGDVRCYVTPAPGVPLQDYIGREVGVIGTRGYMPEQRASHIMARHVTPLEEQSVVR